MTMTATALTGLDGEQITLTDEDRGHLRSRAGGRVLRPGDDGWEQAVQLWNGLAVRHPALVVQPSTAVEVSAAVNFARDRGLRPSVKGGGHHIGGTAIADRGLVLHLAGAIKEHAVDDGAVGNRDARYVIGVNGMWAPGEPRAEEFRQWTVGAATGSGPTGPAGRTSTSRPGTKAMSACEQCTVPTTPSSWRSRGPTTPATCSGPTATSAPDRAF